MGLPAFDFGVAAQKFADGVAGFFTSRASEGDELIGYSDGTVYRRGRGDRLERCTPRRHELRKIRKQAIRESAH